MDLEEFGNEPYDELAKEEDVYYSYRLILGRNPDIGGWRDFTSKLGNLNVHDLASYFLTSPEFKSRKVFQAMVGASPEEKPVLVDLGEYKQFVSPNDVAVGQAIMREGVYEPHVTNALKGVLNPAVVLVDIGANIGYFSLLAAQRVGAHGKVLAFEPNQYNCSLLNMSARVNRFDNIYVYPLAVADKWTAFVYDHLEGSNGVASEEIAFEIDEDYADRLVHRTLVSSAKLDDLLHGIERLDVIKIDVEGAEYRALTGAKGLIQTHRPIIFSEFSPGGLRLFSGVCGEDYLLMLTGEDYHISILEWEGNVVECGQDVERVLRYSEEQAEKGFDHIDIVANP